MIVIPIVVLKTILLILIIKLTFEWLKSKNIYKNRLRQNIIKKLGDIRYFVFLAEDKSIQDMGGWEDLKSICFTFDEALDDLKLFIESDKSVSKLDKGHIVKYNILTNENEIVAIYKNENWKINIKS